MSSVAGVNTNKSDGAKITIVIDNVSCIVAVNRKTKNIENMHISDNHRVRSIFIISYLINYIDFLFSIDYYHIVRQDKQEGIFGRKLPVFLLSKGYFNYTPRFV